MKDLRWEHNTNVEGVKGQLWMRSPVNLSSREGRKWEVNSSQPQKYNIIK